MASFMLGESHSRGVKLDTEWGKSAPWFLYLRFPPCSLFQPAASLQLGQAAKTRQDSRVGLAPACMGRGCRERAASFYLREGVTRTMVHNQPRRSGRLGGDPLSWSLLRPARASLHPSLPASCGSLHGTLGFHYDRDSSSPPPVQSPELQLQAPTRVLLSPAQSALCPATVIH